jgi:putative transcriptional regulator
MANGKRIVEGLRSAVAYAKGNKGKGRATRFNVPDDVDVKAIRERSGLSQKEFAMRFGFSLGTLRHWEQGDRRPEGSARVLLTVIAHNPRIVEETIMAVSSRKAVAVG